MSLFVISLLTTEALILDCTFSVRSVWIIHDVYTCEGKIVETGDPRIVTGVLQKHLPGRTNSDVKGFFVKDLKMKFPPRGIEKFFPDLQTFDFYYSQIEELDKDDLKVFPKLMQFDWPGNAKLFNINHDLFKDNINLKTISFWKTPIKHVALDVFDHLTQLTTLYLDDCKCINEKVVENQSGIEDFIFRISVSCPPTLQMIREGLCSRSHQKICSS